MEDMRLDFYYSHCDTPFRGTVWSLDRAHERAHFLEPLPEVEITDSSSIDCFCSQQCLALGVAAAMAREQVPVPALKADIGPIETCAICRAPVDMSEFHLAYSMSQCQEAGWMMQPLWYDCLAVVCNTCRPLTGAAARAEPTVHEERQPASRREPAAVDPGAPSRRSGRAQPR